MECIDWNTILEPISHHLMMIKLFKTYRKHRQGEITSVVCFGSQVATLEGPKRRPLPPAAKTLSDTRSR